MRAARYAQRGPGLKQIPLESAPLKDIACCAFQRPKCFGVRIARYTQRQANMRIAPVNVDERPFGFADIF